MDPSLRRPLPKQPPNLKSLKSRFRFELTHQITFFFAAHSPDNSFLGFVVSDPIPADAKPLDKKAIGLVYGKDAEFWAVRAELC